MRQYERKVDSAALHGGYYTPALQKDRRFLAPERKAHSDLTVQPTFRLATACSQLAVK
jgi:hypothetical protein